MASGGARARLTHGAGGSLGSGAGLSGAGCVLLVRNMDASCVTALSAAVSSIATVVLVLVTGVYACAAWRQLHEAKSTRLDSLRPLLVVAARRTKYGREILDLTNVGPGPALDVEVVAGGSRITEFLYEQDEDALGGWTGPCEVLPSGRTRRFHPLQGTCVDGRCEVRLLYSSLYRDVPRFESTGVYVFPPR